MKFPDLPRGAGVPAVVSLDFHDVAPCPAFDGLVSAEVEAWLTAIAKTRGRSIAQLDFVFCSDAYLLELNVEHLDHDTLTDIITFDLSDDAAPDAPIEGECYVSQDRVEDNAASFGESPERELLRVLSHGLLHLCGLGDKSDAEIGAMRAAEEEALQLWDTRQLT